VRGRWLIVCPWPTTADAACEFTGSRGQGGNWHDGLDVELEANPG